MFHRHN